MKASLLSLGVLLAHFSLALCLPEMKLFSDFATKYSKSYPNPHERQFRFQVFRTNLRIIEQLNAKEGSTIYGITKFADLTPSEFKEKYLNFKQDHSARYQKKGELAIEDIDPKDIPTNFDWRDKGAVTPVYDQGQCGSCWAFSATEAIESQWFLAGNPLTELSPQQIVDCDLGNGDEGCNGGDTPTAYEYVIKAGGMENSTAYPYTAEDGNCQFNVHDVKATIKSWGYVTTKKDENKMQSALYQRGPLSICVDAETWQFYVGGVVSYFCGTDLDHCVLITGFQDYTTWDGAVKPIWMIRNSWGADWGENGYIYVERGYDLCGVADEVTLPIVK